MLMFFEGMMCKQRLSSVSMLRQMRRPAIPVFAFRVGEWMVVSSDELVPGDLISVASCSKSRKGNDESIIPCDAMLVRGSCVINEAMLTGETVPQVKETIKGADDINGIVNCENEGYLKWRRYMLFSGTSILQHTELSEIELRKSVHEGIPSSPNRGCIAVVIRTSFGTSQVIKLNNFQVGNFTL